jgi:hypothetical protein
VDTPTEKRLEHTLDLTLNQELRQEPALGLE